MPKSQMVGIQVCLAPSQPKRELRPSKNHNFLPKNAHNSETAYFRQKILPPSEAQRKITPDRVPQPKICDGHFFPLQWLMKRFWHVRQKHAGVKFDANYSLCHNTREISPKFSLIFGSPFAQFA